MRSQESVMCLWPSHSSSDLWTYWGSTAGGLNVTTAKEAPAHLKTTMAITCQGSVESAYHFPNSFQRQLSRWFKPPKTHLCSQIWYSIDILGRPSVKQMRHNLPSGRAQNSCLSGCLLSCTPPLTNMTDTQTQPSPGRLIRQRTDQCPPDSHQIMLWALLHYVAAIWWQNKLNLKEFFRSFLSFPFLSFPFLSFPFLSFSVLWVTLHAKYMFTPMFNWLQKCFITLKPQSHFSVTDVNLNW